MSKESNKKRWKGAFLKNAQNRVAYLYKEKGVNS